MVIAESRLHLTRDISVTSPQFESYLGSEEGDWEPRVLDFRKTSSSVNLENSGNVQLVIKTVAARDLEDSVLRGFWLDGELQYGFASYFLDILPLVDAKRHGAVNCTDRFDPPIQREESARHAPWG